jgi:hypothetical protein
MLEEEEEEEENMRRAVRRMMVRSKAVELTRLVLLGVSVSGCGYLGLGFRV